MTRWVAKASKQRSAWRQNDKHSVTDLKVYICSWHAFLNEFTFRIQHSNHFVLVFDANSPRQNFAQTKEPKKARNEWTNQIRKEETSSEASNKFKWLFQLSRLQPNPSNKFANEKIEWVIFLIGQKALSICSFRSYAENVFFFLLLFRLRGSWRQRQNQWQKDTEKKAKQRIESPNWNLFESMYWSWQFR